MVQQPLGSRKVAALSGDSFQIIRFPQSHKLRTGKIIADLCIRIAFGKGLIMEQDTAVNAQPLFIQFVPFFSCHGTPLDRKESRPGRDGILQIAFSA